MSNNGSSNSLVLKVEDLVLYFRTTKGVVQAVDHVDFELAKNRAVVIIGESGCGKSSLAKGILRLLPRNVHTYTGRVYLEGQEIMGLDEETFRMKIRWVKMSLVPQAAMNALNPVLRVSDQVAEALLIHYPNVSKREAIERVREMFRYVGVPDSFLHRYPFELSGGMRQRVAIAMAMITRPPLIILDEPTSALDVLTQANIMNVLKQIKWETGTSYILITHDVATSSELADDVAVMYAGQVVEMSDAASFFKEPLHPYAKMLMAAVPKLRGDDDLEFIPGQPPSLLNPPKGCRFADRCPYRMAQCEINPPMFRVGDRKVRCWLYEKDADGIYGTHPEPLEQAHV
ncbi:MAG: ABC transporter ATP-binding protein [Chloroflexi bacterium]|nr:ABC transporter ATP-binding protein [Chloroflexota bacterium]